MPGVSRRALGGGLPDETAEAAVPVVTPETVATVEGVVDPETFGH